MMIYCELISEYRRHIGNTCARVIFIISMSSGRRKKSNSFIYMKGEFAIRGGGAGNRLIFF